MKTDFFGHTRHKIEKTVEQSAMVSGSLEGNWKGGKTMALQHTTPPHNSHPTVSSSRSAAATHRCQNLRWRGGCIEGEGTRGGALYRPGGGGPNSRASS